MVSHGQKMRENVFTNNVAEHPRTYFPWAVICRYGNLREKTKPKKQTFLTDAGLGGAY